jgi:hypothetical protein
VIFVCVLLWPLHIAHCLFAEISMETLFTYIQLLSAVFETARNTFPSILWNILFNCGIPWVRIHASSPQRHPVCKERGFSMDMIPLWERMECPDASL